MANIVEEFIKGRKTFFIAPDKSLFPETYLEEYLSHGYECYFIEPDSTLSIPQKTQVILSVFKDSIVFFNIDIPLENISWPNFLRVLQEKFPQSCFGILYAKKQSLEEKKLLDKQYLIDIGIKGGSVQLEYQKRNNFALIERTLFANQAQGRRKQVRAVCNGSCTVKMPIRDGYLIQAKLVDISLSHFSIILESGDEQYFKEAIKISNALFLVKGLHFTSDAVNVMIRPTVNGNLCIFAFTSKSGKAELDPINKQLLIPKLYSILLDNFKNLSTMLFKTQQERRIKEGKNEIDIW